MTITVDNASSNDTALEYLKSKFKMWGDSCILEGDWSHVRCMAHIMNLIVQEGLKSLEGSIERIRQAVRWVRLSTVRGKKFKNFALLEGIKCEKCLCLDVPTRWNSTYLMLIVAIEYRNVFDKFAEEDYVCLCDLQDGVADGVPVSTDWDNLSIVEGKMQYLLDENGRHYLDEDNG
ncbi:zinc finger BED domain-containing protein RICESLEEPER 2-like [Rutidosis leptorrhynchoides]|uniref:zinc finger BED domain-containing protein RICESLEEPER 2-like n=1 Tax=Rutidosis leptorrhynchoides TaxID=125765 RepID=UPI003A99F12E